MIAASVPSGGYDPMPKGLVFYAPGNGGYSDRRLDEKRYLISVHTGANTPFQRIKDIALTRASERTLELKNKFFKLGPARLKLECLGSRVGTATNIASGRPTYELEIELAGNKPGHNLIDAEKTFQKLRPTFDVQPSTEEKVKAMGFYRHRCMTQQTN